MSRKLHPSAIIDPQAELGEDVEIGPGAIVEAGAKIGAGCVIQAHAVITGHVEMGEGNAIGYGAIVGGDPQDFAFRREIVSHVRIGRGNRIREHCTIHRGTAEGAATVLGDDCFLMAGSHLGHNVRLGSRVVLANNVLLGGHVHVGDQVFIGGGCVFHQFVRMGRLAIAQGASAFSKDVPPFTMAAERNTVAGLNVVGLRRAGFAPEQRREIKRAFTLLYRSGRNIRQALAAAEEHEWGAEAREFFTFVAEARQRGVCGLLRTQREAGAGEPERE